MFHIFKPYILEIVHLCLYVGLCWYTACMYMHVQYVRMYVRMYVRVCLAYLHAYMHVCRYVYMGIRTFPPDIYSFLRMNSSIKAEMSVRNSTSI